MISSLLPALMCWLCFSDSVNDYGLFLADEDPRKGIWLESLRNLEYYLLRQGVSFDPVH